MYCKTNDQKNPTIIQYYMLVNLLFTECGLAILTLLMHTLGLNKGVSILCYDNEIQTSHSQGKETQMSKRGRLELILWCWTRIRNVTVDGQIRNKCSTSVCVSVLLWQSMYFLAVCSESRSNNTAGANSRPGSQIVVSKRRLE